MAIENLIAELKRRRVFRVLVGWAIVSFAVLQIYESVMHGLHLPEWTLSFVVVVLALGFPVAVVLAWAFDVNAGGIERATAAASPGLRGPRLALLLVGVGLLAATPGLVWYLVRASTRPTAESTASSPAAAPSVAVLPFTDMSAQKDQEYFSDGIAEEILNALAQVEGLNVAGRTSSFSFKGKSVKIEEIGRELHVAAVLEGSVRKSGDQVRVTAQLINTADGYHLWTASYDRRLTEIFAMQDEIARSVVAALKVKLLPGQRPAARERRTTKPEAYNEYLVAQQFANRYTKDGDRLAVAFYEKAVALDPGYAPAWAGLARARHKFAGYYSVTVDDLVRSEERALAEAEKAIALDPDLAEGYGVRGKLRSIFKRDWAGGQADLAHALALDPGNATTLASQADLIASLGRLREAIALQRRATELDPLNADTWTFLGLMYRSSGELDLARQAMNRLLEIAPESAGGQCGLASTSLLEGQPAAALSSSGGCRFEFLRLQNVAMAQHDLGRSRESQEALDTLIATHSLAAFQIAQVYAWRGERDRAFDWLERAYEGHDEGLKFLKHSAFLRSLRGDPRYTVLLRKMNLPVD